MSHRTLLHAAAVAFMGLVLPAMVSAQVLGTFPWQMQPFCNVVTMTLTSTPAGGWTLDGSDDQCGATNRGSAVGVATFNGGGNVTLNFSIVTAPSGKPVHVSAVVSPATGSGTWTDSAGNAGTFAFFGNTPGLPARPSPASGLPPAVITTTEIATGAVGATDINSAEVQARVTGTCPAGQAITGIASDGTVTCVAVASAEVRFKASSLGGQAHFGGGTSVTTWGTISNVGGGTYDATTGIFTVPSAGTYLISATVGLAANGTETGNRCVYFLLSGQTDGANCKAPSATFESLQFTTVASLAAGAEVLVRVQNNTPATFSSSDAGTAVFTVTRLR